MLRNLLLVFLGGGLGSALRYATQLAVRNHIAPSAFPWSTFAINVVGSLLIGLFYSLCTKFNLPDEVRLLLTAGLCGGFTTFSTFSNDGLLLIQQGDRLLCAAYIILSVILGIAACYLGAKIGRMWL